MCGGEDADEGSGELRGVFDFLDAALVEQAALCPALRSAGDFAVGDEHVVLHGILETGGRDLRLRGGGERGVSQRAGDALVDGAVAFARAEGEEGMRARDDEREGEIVAVRDDAAAGPAAHDVATGSGCDGVAPFPKVAEGERGTRPAVEAQHGKGGGAEERFVDRHVERAVVRLGVEHCEKVVEKHARK